MAKKKKSEKKKKTSEKKEETEEVCEVFEVEKGGKEKIEKTCADVDVEHASKKELKDYNETLRNVFIGLAIFVVIVGIGIYYMYSLTHFTLHGLKWDMVKEGEMLFYKTAFPVMVKNQAVPYNIYIRNDPRELEKEIPFLGKIDFGIKFSKDNMNRLVLNFTEEFDCGGHEIIGPANFNNLKVIGIKVVRDENATCDSEGRYMHLNIVSGENTEIYEDPEKNDCFEMRIANCEILKGMERFMVEAFAERFNE